MRCPRCKMILCRIQYEGMPLSTCPDCGGEFVDLNRLRMIRTRRDVTFSAKDAMRLRKEKTGPERDEKLICPRCGALMKKGRYGHSDVVVDLCPACRGLWLDDQELEKLQVLAESEASDAEASVATNAPSARAKVASTLVKARGRASRELPPAATPSTQSLTQPPLWCRMLLASLLIYVVVVWSIEPVREHVGDLLGCALPAPPIWMALALAALALIALGTFRKATVEAGKIISLTLAFAGVPWTHRWRREEIECIGTDYKAPGVLTQLFYAADRHRNLIRSLFYDYEPSGISYLYLVLASGRRVLLYRGKSESRLSEWADMVQEGLGLDVRRL